MLKADNIGLTWAHYTSESSQVNHKLKWTMVVLGLLNGQRTLSTDKIPCSNDMETLGGLKPSIAQGNLGRFAAFPIRPNQQQTSTLERLLFEQHFRVFDMQTNNAIGECWYQRFIWSVAQLPGPDRTPSSSKRLALQRQLWIAPALWLPSNHHSCPKPLPTSPVEVVAHIHHKVRTALGGLGTSLSPASLPSQKKRVPTRGNPCFDMFEETTRGPRHPTERTTKTRPDFPFRASAESAARCFICLATSACACLGVSSFVGHGLGSLSFQSLKCFNSIGI